MQRNAPHLKHYFSHKDNRGHKHPRIVSSFLPQGPQLCQAISVAHQEFITKQKIEDAEDLV